MFAFVGADEEHREGFVDDAIEHRERAIVVREGVIGHRGLCVCCPHKPEDGHGQQEPHAVVQARCVNCHTKFICFQTEHSFVRMR